MIHKETMLSSKTVYTGKVLDVHQDMVRLENGVEAQRDLVVHHGGVCIAAIDDEDNLLLVNQFRYPYQKELLEIPAGKLELGENPRECGIRELEEETGCKAEIFEDIGQMYPTPGYCNEIIYMYRACNLQKTKQKLDEDEFLTVLKVPFSKAVEMVLSGEIKDGKTQVAILKLKVLRETEAKV